MAFFRKLLPEKAEYGKLKTGKTRKFIREQKLRLGVFGLLIIYR